MSLGQKLKDLKHTYAARMPDKAILTRDQVDNAEDFIMNTYWDLPYISIDGNKLRLAYYQAGLMYCHDATAGDCEWYSFDLNREGNLNLFPIEVLVEFNETY